MGSLQDAFGSDYERQSWRDNYNGGRAAGDWTGNVNRQLDREREAFGTTWSGSSSQPSALELARAGGRRARMSGPAAGRVETPAVGAPAPVPEVAPIAPAVPSRPGPGGTGAASGSLSAGPRVPTRGPGSALTVTAPQSSGVRIGEYMLFPDERFPNVEDFWEPRYGEPGEWLGGGVNIAADLDRNGEQLLRQAVKVRPGSIADQVLSSDFWSDAPGRFNSWVESWNHGSDGSMRSNAFGFPSSTGSNFFTNHRTPGGNDYANPMDIKPMSAW